MVSAIISSYDRPHNLDELISFLKSYVFISEIIILHGHEKYANHIEGCRNINNWEVNKKLYTFSRLDAVPLAKNDIVLLNDDDTLPSKKLLDNMLDVAQKDSSSFSGTFGRACNGNGYGFTGDLNTVLLNTVMSSKDVFSNIFYEMKTAKYKTLFDKVIAQEGNCEDLFFNKVYVDVYQKKPIIVKGDFKNLDNTNGFHNKPKHYEQRDEFCRCFLND